jgi:tRNA A37 N6-isopentenylltransferase MiaA
LRAAANGGGWRQALGYQQLAAVLDGTATLESAADEIARVTLAYARRQRTWFKKEPIAARFAAPPPLAAALALLGRPGQDAAEARPETPG